MLYFLIIIVSALLTATADVFLFSLNYNIYMDN